MATASTKKYRATESFYVATKDHPVYVEAGAVVTSSDPAFSKDRVESGLLAPVEG